MARYYRRRYTRVVKPKKKWASNIVNLLNVKGDDSGKDLLLAQTLVQNSSQINEPTPVILKAGNFKVQMDISYTTGTAAWVEARTVVMFAPEGIDDTSFTKVSNLIERHPEWVMAWKYASIDYTGAAATTGVQTMQFSSRLKRNLNSGDKINIYTLLTTNEQGKHFTNAHVGGLAQFWTCAN